MLRVMAGSWFDTARFGLFVHWSHCSQRGIEVSWPLVGGIFALPLCSEIGVEEYEATATTFNPRRWDPRGLARTARRAGMRYAVITAKHHDGFAMFHTRESHYSIERTPFRRDVVREFLEAMRQEGLRVGLYFSLIDWHHPDYPAWTEADKPYVFGRWRQSEPAAWARYLRFMFAQVRELLTGYGQIDVMWFDGGWERTAEQWRSAELDELVRSLQPGILVNDRLPGMGDFATPEQFVPPVAPARPWETCMTMNESWGYNAADSRWKDRRWLIHTICEVAGRGGNLLLNVGPRGDGSLQPEAEERLAAIETWMAKNGASITGTEPGIAPWQFYGPSTRAGNTLYLHLLMRPYDTVTVRGVRIRRLRSIHALSTGSALAFDTRCSIVDAALNPDPHGEATVKVPSSALDPYATVLALQFDGEPT